MATPEEIQSLKEARERSKARRAERAAEVKAPPPVTVSETPSNPLGDKFNEFMSSGAFLGPIGPALKNITKGGFEGMLGLGADMAASSIAGPAGPAMVFGAEALGTEAFGPPDAAGLSIQRAGTAAEVGQAAMRKVPGAAGKVLPAAFAFAEQVAEGKDISTSAKNAALLAMPDIAVRGAKKLSDSDILQKGWNKFMGFISPNDISKNLAITLKNAPDTRFDVEEIGSSTVVKARNFVKVPGNNRKVHLNTKALASFASQAEQSPQAAAKMYKGNPFAFAVAMQTLDDPAVRSKTQVSWFYDNVLKNTERVDPGDLTKAVNKYGKDGVELAFGKPFLNGLDDIETAMKFAPPTTSLKGDLLGEWQYSKRRIGFDIARAAITGTALGGGIAASSAVGGVVTVSLPVLLYLGAINPKTTKLLAMATKNKNILATRAFFNEAAQAGLSLMETVDGNHEVALPPTGQDKQFQDMLVPGASPSGAF